MADVKGDDGISDERILKAEGLLDPRWVPCDCYPTCKCGSPRPGYRRLTPQEYAERGPLIDLVEEYGSLLGVEDERLPALLALCKRVLNVLAVPVPKDGQWATFRGQAARAAKAAGDWPRPMPRPSLLTQAQWEVGQLHGALWEMQQALELWHRLAGLNPNGAGIGLDLHPQVEGLVVTLRAVTGRRA